jgi:hypothetical protein
MMFMRSFPRHVVARSLLLVLGSLTLASCDIFTAPERTVTAYVEVDEVVVTNALDVAIGTWMVGPRMLASLDLCRQCMLASPPDVPAHTTRRFPVSSILRYPDEEVATLSWWRSRWNAATSEWEGEDGGHVTLSLLPERL